MDMPLVDVRADHVQALINKQIQNKMHPADMYRCGISAAHLAVLGYTLLPLSECYQIEDLIAGFALEWKDLVALGFQPSMLQHRNLLPVVSLAKAGLSAENMLSAFSFTCDNLFAWNLTPEELYFLGFRAAHLCQLNMTAHHVIQAVRSASLCELTDDTIDWWIRNMEFTRSLYKSISSKTTKTEDARCAYLYLQTKLIT